jgi:hypothetical protein
VKPVTAILHSEDGDLISVADSLELSRNSGLPETAAFVVGNEHRLAAAIGRILMTCWHARREILAKAALAVFANRPFQRAVLGF